MVQPFPFEGDLDYILHAAGIASPYYYRAYPLETLDVAVTGTRQTLELAKRTGARITFFSSSEIYGDPDPANVPTTESYRGYVSCLGPRACYDESKRLGETLCRIYHTQFGVHTNMIRPFNVFGPGMQELDYRVMPNFASRILGGKPLHVYGTGEQTRTFCYITDAIQGFIRVMLYGVPGEPYNIGNPTPEISMVDLTKEIETVIQKKVDLNLVPYPDSYPADEPNRRCPDITKARHQLKYDPQVPLREGIKRFFAWASENYKGEQ
jgi:UDP-glucuronate decarboxylase